MEVLPAKQVPTGRPWPSWPPMVQAMAWPRTKADAALAAAAPQSSSAGPSPWQTNPRAGAAIPANRTMCSPTRNVSPSTTAIRSALAAMRLLAGALAGASDGPRNKDAAINMVAAPPIAASHTLSGGMDAPERGFGRKIRRLWFKDKGTPRSTARRGDRASRSWGDSPNPMGRGQVQYASRRRNFSNARMIPGLTFSVRAARYPTIAPTA